MAEHVSTVQEVYYYADGEMLAEAMTGGGDHDRVSWSPAYRLRPWPGRSPRTSNHGDSKLTPPLVRDLHLGDAMAFPENLRRIRLAHFLSQSELARRSGVHAITITRLEAGRTAPSTRTVRALAEALGVPPADLASPEEVAEADKWQRLR